MLPRLISPINSSDCHSSSTSSTNAYSPNSNSRTPSSLLGRDRADDEEESSSQPSCKRRCSQDESPKNTAMNSDNNETKKPQPPAHREWIYEQPSTSHAYFASPISGAVSKPNNARTPLATVQQHNNAKSPRSPASAIKELTQDEKLQQLDRMQRIPIDSVLARADNRTKSELQYRGDNYFERLSDEVILAIFMHVPKKALFRCSLVCRRFHIVSLDPSLWQRLELGGRSLRAGGLGRVLMRGVAVLRLAQTKIATPIFDVDVRGPIASRLQYLDLSMAHIAPYGLLQLMSCCRHLKKLSLEHMYVNDAICVQIGENRNMEVLNMAMCEGVHESSVRRLLGNMQKLHTLNISWTDLDTAAVRGLVQCISSRMLRINVAGCRTSMTDLMLFHLVKRCPELVELDVSDCAALTADAISTVRKLEHLEYLSMSRCYNIPASAYLTLNDIRSLHFLDIFGVLSDQALVVLKTSFPTMILNRFIHSSVGRPTVGSRRTSVWGQRTREF